MTQMCAFMATNYNITRATLRKRAALRRRNTARWPQPSSLQMRHDISFRQHLCVDIRVSVGVFRKHRRAYTLNSRHAAAEFSPKLHLSRFWVESEDPRAPLFGAIRYDVQLLVVTRPTSQVVFWIQRRDRSEFAVCHRPQSPHSVRPTHGDLAAVV